MYLLFKAQQISKLWKLTTLVTHLSVTIVDGSIQLQAVLFTTFTNNKLFINREVCREKENFTFSFFTICQAYQRFLEEIIIGSYLIQPVEKLFL